MSTYPDLLATRETTLLDLLDTILDTGVVAQGELVISVAEVDLVFVGIKLVLASVETMQSWREPARSGRGNGGNGHGQQVGREAVGSAQYPESDVASVGGPQFDGGSPQREASDLELRDLPKWQSDGQPVEHEGPRPARKTHTPHRSASRLPVDPDKVEQGLAKLVLTVVELLRRLLEKQGIRRMEGGSLTEEETERMGRAFQRLEQKMEELKAVFGLTGEELNLNLGPLGNLI
jgi:hypothetical protein